MAGAALLVMAGGCYGNKGECPAKKAPAVKVPAKKCTALRLQKNFFLPEKIYAVPGVEANIYFKNIFLAVNHANYLFDVTGKVGSQGVKRWSYVPADKDAGKSFDLSISVKDENGVLVAQGKTKVLVAKKDAGKGKKLAILMVGDSLTNATVYPRRVHTLFKGKDNPALTMIGSHRGGGRKPLPGGVAHEGYGGWTWATFMHRYQDASKMKTPVRKFYATSKFLTKNKAGKVVFDLKQYFKKYSKGVRPDIVTFQLGVNDVFSANDSNRCARIKMILNNADRLLDAFRKELPDAIFAVGYVTGGSNQDGFGTNYKNGQTAWGYYVNQFRLNQALEKHFAAKKDPKIVLVPVNVNLDTENNFPVRNLPVNMGNRRRMVRQSNGVHPAADGYNQMGDSYYAFMKYILSNPRESVKK